MFYFLYNKYIKNHSMHKIVADRSQMTNFEKVGFFMKIFGQEVKTSAGLSTDKINSLRISLINEELEELKKSII